MAFVTWHPVMRAVTCATHVRVFILEVYQNINAVTNDVTKKRHCKNNATSADPASASVSVQKSMVLHAVS